jgi:hypothetical protein
MINTAPYVMFLMRADPLRGQVGGGWALEIDTLLGPEMAMREASAIWTQISRDFQGPNPSHLDQVMDLPASKTFRTGPYKA